jgi:thioredoxin-like negative regulator of GroEL
MELWKLFLGAVIGLALVGACGCSSSDAQPFAPHNNQGPGFDSQLRSALALMRPQDRNKAIALVAKDAANVGDVHWATQALKAINDWEVRDEAALTVAVRLAKGGKDEAAHEIAKTIASSVVRDETLKVITKPK